MKVKSASFWIVIILMLTSVCKVNAQNKWHEDNLERFIDGVMASHMQNKHITAATVSIVKDGEIQLAKGYGVSDLESNAAIDPNASLFRIGSVTKLFTYTAIMQLYEQGKLDLDDDVNKYLRSYQFPNEFNQPTTIRDLMTHTSGLEASFLGGIFHRTKAEVLTIVDGLNKFKPKQVNPPGQNIAYSNVGVTVLGRIIENISGESYCTYIKTNIFNPLQMANSDICEEEELMKQVVKPYKYASDEYVSMPFGYLGQWAPAGAMNSTATDMANFMIAHLQNGQFEASAILKPETAKLMHSPAMYYDPNVPGLAYGFFEKWVNGYKGLSHGGATMNFFTYLFIVPNENVGIFYSFAGTDASSGLRDIYNLFMDEYYPNTTTAPAVYPIDDFTPYLGAFRTLRMESSNVAKFLSFDDEVHVEQGGDNTLIVSYEDNVTRYFPISETVFQQKTDDQRLVFVKGDDGQFQYLHFGKKPYRDFKRVVGHERTWLTTTGIMFALFMSLMMLNKSIIGWKSSCKNPLPKMTTRVILANAVFTLTIMLYLAVSLASLDFVGMSFDGLPPMLGNVTYLFYIYSCLVIAMIYLTINIFKNKEGRVRERIYSFCFLIGCCFFVWFSYVWNLMVL